MSDRRAFFVGSAAVAISTVPALALTGPQEKKEDGRLSAELVSKFVGKSHGDLPGIKEMLDAEPALINATWDWGDGDWETGLGAASHVGRRDIAEFLIEKGARLDAFAATMLGVKPIVEQMLIAFPKLHAVKGPHGISLLTHAIYGKEKANDVFDLLLEKGADVNARTNQKSTPLFSAAITNNVRAAELLIANGAEIGAMDAQGATALSVAQKRKHKAIVDLLSQPPE